MREDNTFDSSEKRISPTDEISALYSFIDLQLQGIENYFNLFENMLKSFEENEAESLLRIYRERGTNKNFEAESELTISEICLHPLGGDYLPLYSDEIFYDTMTVIIFSYFERFTTNICFFIAEKKNLNIGKSDIIGNEISSFKKFIKNFGGFDLTDFNLWFEIECIKVIRNIIVHGCGVVDHSKTGTNKHIRHLVDKGLIEKYDLTDEDSNNKKRAYMETDFRDIVVRSDFCRNAIETMKLFFSSLHEAHLREYSKMSSPK